MDIQLKQRYRLTQWGSNGELGYEAFDHKSDKNEHKSLTRLFNVMDTLKLRLAESLLFYIPEVWKTI